MESTSQALKAEAIRLGLCEKWTSEWVDGLTQQDLIDRFVKGYDFCVKHNFPDNDYVRNHFSRELLHKNNIYISEDVRLYNVVGNVILHGECKGKIIETGASAVVIYARHNTHINVGVGDASRVFLHLYDNASAIVAQLMSGRVTVFLHGDGCKVEHKGNVKIIQK